jgi:hypothetical protein
MTAAALPVWCSLLFVPVTAKRFVERARLLLGRQEAIAACESKRRETIATLAPPGSPPRFRTDPPPIPSPASGGG